MFQPKNCVVGKTVGEVRREMGMPGEQGCDAILTREDTQKVVGDDCIILENDSIMFRLKPAKKGCFFEDGKCIDCDTPEPKSEDSSAGVRVTKEFFHRRR